VDTYTEERILNGRMATLRAQPPSISHRVQLCATPTDRRARPRQIVELAGMTNALSRWLLCRLTEQQLEEELTVAG